LKRLYSEHPVQTRNVTTVLPQMKQKTASCVITFAQLIMQFILCTIQPVAVLSANNKKDLPVLMIRASCISGPSTINKHWISPLQTQARNLKTFHN